MSSHQRQAGRQALTIGQTDTHGDAAANKHMPPTDSRLMKGPPARHPLAHAQLLSHLSVEAVACCEYAPADTEVVPPL